MIVAIDIGGTKTLVAAVNQNGEIDSQIKFPTPVEYQEFLKELGFNISQVTSDQITVACVAVPGWLDRSRGYAERLGNLPWTNINIATDISQLIGGATVLIENDANLAALSEANSLDNLNQRVQYMTFSTGIGTGFVINGYLAPDLLDSEGGHMLLEQNGVVTTYEKTISGHAIVERYGKMASELDDPEIWKSIAHEMAIVIINNAVLFLPDTVIIGGGVGSYFHKYGEFLINEVNNMYPFLEPPKATIGAKAAEEAVILGCILMAQRHEQHS